MGGGLRAAVLDTTSPVPVAPVAPVACSKNADLAVFYGTSASARSQNRAPHPMGLHGAQRDPQAPQEEPNGCQKDPRGGGESNNIDYNAHFPNIPYIKENKPIIQTTGKWGNHQKG